MFEQRHGTSIVADINTETLLSAQTTCCKAMAIDTKRYYCYFYLYNYFTLGRDEKYCDQSGLSVCFFVCLSARMSKILRPNFTKISRAT